MDVQTHRNGCRVLEHACFAHIAEHGHLRSRLRTCCSTGRNAVARRVLYPRGAKGRPGAGTCAAHATRGRWCACAQNQYQHQGRNRLCRYRHGERTTLALKTVMLTTESHPHRLAQQYQAPPPTCRFDVLVRVPVCVPVRITQLIPVRNWR